MLRKLLEWIKRRAEHSKAAEFGRGWDWAAGELLRGKPADALWQQIENDIEMDCQTAFDSGAIAALGTARAQEYLETQRYRLFNPIC